MIVVIVVVVVMGVTVFKRQLNCLWNRLLGACLFARFCESDTVVTSRVLCTCESAPALAGERMETQR